MAAPIYGRLEQMRRFCRTSHAHKIPRFRGGWVFWVWGGGGGSADFIFMGARIFLKETFGWARVGQNQDQGEFFRFYREKHGKGQAMKR